MDGKTYHPVSKWPMYLTDAGQTMPTAAGDRLFTTLSFARPLRADAKFRTGYVRRWRSGVRVYVHSSVDQA